MAKNKIEIQIRATDKNVKKVTEDTARGFRKMRQGADRAGKGFRGLRQHSANLHRSLVSLKTIAVTAFTALAAYGGLRLARGFINTAASVETLKIQLDTITKGRGLEWFNKLNEWALKMPVDTQRAIEVFKNLSAMGLKPTIKDMTTLVDTTSALGGGADVMMGIARALGQMYTKGKASAEELMQLAERGVPAYEILKDKLKLTGEELEKIAKSGIDVNTVIKALLEGMDERFGGASKAMQETGKGLWTSQISYAKEFQRLVMESGVWDVIKQGLSGIIAKLDKLKETGALKKAATETGAVVLEVIATIIESAGKIPGIMAAITQSIATVGQAAVATLRAIMTVVDELAQGITYPLGEKRIGIRPEVFEEIDKLGKAMAGIARSAEEVGPELVGWGTKARDAAEQIRQMADKTRKNKEEAKQAAEEQKKQAEKTEDTANAAERTGEALTYILDGTKHTVGQTETMAGNFVKIKGAAEEVAAVYDKKIKKLEKESDLIREQIELLKKKSAAAAGGGSGMRWGGPVIRRQEGGAVPGGYGGGDRIPGLLEPGEFVLRKEAARSLGASFLNALNRGEGARDYMVLDLRWGDKSYQMDVIKDSVIERLEQDIRRYRMTRG